MFDEKFDRVAESYGKWIEESGFAELEDEEKMRQLALAVAATIATASMNREHSIKQAYRVADKFNITIKDLVKTIMEARKEGKV